MDANSAALESGSTAAAPSKKWMIWAGRIASALPILAMAMSGAMKMAHAPQMAGGLTGHLGFPEGAVAGIGLLELFSVILYAVPTTSVLGAILVSAYFGGATAAHVRVGDPYLITVALGMLAWLGLYLRDARIRALLPFRAA